MRALVSAAFCEPTAAASATSTSSACAAAVLLQPLRRRGPVLPHTCDVFHASLKNDAKTPQTRRRGKATHLAIRRVPPGTRYHARSDGTRGREAASPLGSERWSSLWLPSVRGETSQHADCIDRLHRQDLRPHVAKANAAPSFGFYSMSNWCNARLVVAGGTAAVARFRRFAHMRPSSLFRPDMAGGRGARAILRTGTGAGSESFEEIV